MRHKLKIASAIICVTLLMLGCAAPAPAPTPTPTPEPTPTPTPAAEFEVISLDIKPPEVMAGETVSITAVVKNTGGSEGTYAAILTVDGVTVETEEVAIAPGSSKVVTFSLVKDAPGTYEIGVGGLSSSLTIKEKLIAKEVELKYDVRKGRDCLSSGGGGYIIDFSPPATPFTIKKVKMAGLLSGSGWEGKNFEVGIWDEDYEVLHSAAYPVTKFVSGAVTWVEVEIPDIEVNGKFYVHVYTGTGKSGGIFICADDSIVNEHSNLTTRPAGGIAKIVPDWPYSTDFWFGDKSKVNWKIRAVGTYIES